MSKKSDEKTQSQKVKDAVEAEVINETSKKCSEKCSRNDNWGVGKVFWGLLFIVFGGLMLINNFGWATVNWGNLWKLWPLAIISAGLSILSFRNIIWKIFVILLMALAAGVAIWVATGTPIISVSTKIQNESVKLISKDIKQADISIKAGAGELHVNSVNQAAVAKATLESNIMQLSTTSVRSGDAQKVNFLLNGSNNWWLGETSNKLNIDLGRSLPIGLNIKTGASDVQVDASRVNLNAFNLKSGASNIDIKFGSIQSLTAVNISSGASSIKFRIPKNSGVRFKLDEGLNSKNLADLSEKSKGLYESNNFIEAQNKIDITASIGVSSINIERY